MLESIESPTVQLTDHPCLYCGSTNTKLRKRTKLENSRGLLQKRRLWHCRACGRKFQTIEVYEDADRATREVVDAVPENSR